MKLSNCKWNKILSEKRTLKNTALVSHPRRENLGLLKLSDQHDVGNARLLVVVLNEFEAELES